MERSCLLVVITACFFATSSFAGLPGDINQDDRMTLEDIILGLQVVAGSAPTIPGFTDDIDVDKDGHLGLSEVLNDLRMISQYGEFGIVTSAGQVWMDRNLGASRVAQSFGDAEAYGDLYQWGRGRDGHEKRDSGTTSANATSDTPGHGLFITEDAAPGDWRTPQNDNLWQGVSGINNPCPSGFRLPTDTELESEKTSWVSKDSAGAFASPLKLAAGGLRLIDGSTADVGGGGYYWSNTVDITNSSRLYFRSDMASTGSGVNRARGQSVRCIQDNDCNGDLGGTAYLDNCGTCVGGNTGQTPCTHKIVFVSSNTYNGNLGGLTGADAKCQTLANNAGLSGTFKAWLSDSSGSPSTRFTKSNVPYKLVNGAIIADNWSDLTNGDIQNPINIKETGQAYTSIVWSQTSYDGTLQTYSSYNICAQWTSSSSIDGYRGLSGDSRVKTSQWTEWAFTTSNPPQCWSTLAIYCFEQ